MKSKLTKLLSLLLVAALGAFLFAGCAGSETPSASNGTDKPSESVKPEGSDDVTEISWYIWGNRPTDGESVEAALNEKTVKDIGVYVNYKWQPSGDAVATALAAGDKDLDIVFTTSWWANFVSSAQNGYFMDIKDLLETKAPALKSALPDTLWNGATIDGGIYMVPTWKDTAEMQYWIARKDIVESANALEEFNAIAGHTELAALTPLLEKIKAWHDADPANNVYSDGCTAPLNFGKNGFNPVVTGNAGESLTTNLVYKNGKVVSTWDDEVVIDNLYTLKDWADRGLSNGKGAISIEVAPSTIVVSAGRGWDGAQYTAWGGPTVGYDTLLVERDGPYLATVDIQVGNAIGVNSEKSEAAIKFLEYINTNKDIRNMLSYGVEGKNWKFNEENPALIDVLSSGWAPLNFTLGSMEQLYVTSDMPAGYENMYKEITHSVNDVEPSDILGFVVDNTEISTLTSVCGSIISEYTGPLYTGDVDDVDATLAEMKERLTEAGYEDLKAAVQKQIDDYKASK